MGALHKRTHIYLQKLSKDIMTSKIFLNIACLISLTTALTTQAIDPASALLATAATVAGFRAADKDPKPENKLVTYSDVQQGKTTLPQYIDDRIVGQEEQAAAVTDYKPVVILNEKDAQWKTINIKDAVTGEIIPTYHRITPPQKETVFQGAGALEYCKASGLGYMLKLGKKLNTGLRVAGIGLGTQFLLRSLGASYDAGQWKAADIKPLKTILLAMGTLALCTNGISPVCPTR
jgi:hypothetical protein